VTLAYIRLAVLPVVFDLLPETASSEASAMLVAIGWQESRFVHRRQVNGPARGYWQFELGGIHGVLSHPSTRVTVREVMGQMGYPKTATPLLCHDAIQHNDVMAGCFARLLLWTLPQALPTRDQPEVGLAQYLAAWRPGKPHPETWAQAWAHGWGS
jgi:hypothetical protein